MLRSQKMVKGKLLIYNFEISIRRIKVMKKNAIFELSIIDVEEKFNGQKVTTIDGVGI